MKYNRISRQQAEKMAKDKTIVYGCAYQINNENLAARLRCLPVKGMIVPGRWSFNFAELTKRGEPRTSGLVDYGSRHYADTYEECVEIYNSLVQKRIDKLVDMQNDAKMDLITPEQ